MLIREYLAQRSAIGGVTTGNISPQINTPDKNAENSFAKALDSEIRKREVDFSAHAIRRLESRQIDIVENDKIDRLKRVWKSQRKREARKVSYSLTTQRS